MAATAKSGTASAASLDRMGLDRMGSVGELVIGDRHLHVLGRCRKRVERQISGAADEDDDDEEQECQKETFHAGLVMRNRAVLDASRRHIRGLTTRPPAREAPCLRHGRRFMLVFDYGESWTVYRPARVVAMIAGSQ